MKWLRAVSQSGVFFLMRYKAGIVLWQGKQRLDLLSSLPQVGGERLERLVTVGADKVVSGVRLVAECVPDEVAAQRQERIRAYADGHGKPVNPLLWERAHWTLVLTNVPVGMLSFEQVPTLVHGLLGHLPLGRALGLMTQSVQGGCSIAQRSTRLSTSYRLLTAWEPGLT